MLRTEADKKNWNEEAWLSYMGRYACLHHSPLVVSIRPRLPKLIATALDHWAMRFEIVLLAATVTALSPERPTNIHDDAGLPKIPLTGSTRVQMRPFSS